MRRPHADGLPLPEGRRRVTGVSFVSGPDAVGRFDTLRRPEVTHCPPIGQDNSVRIRASDEQGGKSHLGCLFSLPPSLPARHQRAGQHGKDRLNAGGEAIYVKVNKIRSRGPLSAVAASVMV